MTSKEALETIKELELDPYKGYKTVDYLYKNEIEILEKLVERDTPKKVSTGVWGVDKCSKCKTQLFNNKEKFCCECGQRLDWE